MKMNWKKAIGLFVLTICVIGAFGFISNYINEAKQTVEVVSERILIPGGQSVGIKMNVKGVLVVGLEEIETEDSIVSPGYTAGLEIGDIVTSVDGQEVHYAGDVSKIVNAAKEKKKDSSINIKVSRKDKELSFDLMPVKEKTSGEYKIGLWVKEKIAGIGTMTFYDPKTNAIASLGHGIYESRTGTLLEAGNGELLRTEVKSIKEGHIGKPGEIRGIFYADDEAIGDVKKNSLYGIYAKGKSPEKLNLSRPIVMGYQDQIEEGDAYILTTIDGDTVEKFDIKITRVNRQSNPGSKSMEIEVVDDRLLKYCGGIVQGMSGSPIIQNNRLIGAVTHVFVNNPTKGYGIFAEWMVREAEKI